MDDVTRLLTKVATLYYRNQLTQDEIAHRLGLSRQTVGRHLHRALQQGIVAIEIRSPLLFSAELEYRLESAYGLAEAVVLAPPADTEESIKSTLGQAAAVFLRRRVQRGDVIGVSWSSTLLECAHQLVGCEPREVTVVQMNGSLDRTSYPTRAEYTVHRIAQAFGGEAVTLVAPMLVDRADIRASLLSDSRIAAALELARRADVAVFGVGDVTEESSLYKTGYIEDQLLAELRAGGAVGDICGRFYDGDGRPVLAELEERTVAIELAGLREKRLSLAVAGGARKVAAIRGALLGGYCNALITDEDTARALVEERA